MFHKNHLFLDKIPVGEMPAHRHGLYVDVEFPANKTNIQNDWKQALANKFKPEITNEGYGTASVGGNNFHNNISPYVVVYYFKRVS